MGDYKKFVAVPADMNAVETQPMPEFVSTETQTGFRKRRERSTFDKAGRWAKIILKLANVNGFDDDLRIKREDNTFVSNSNVISLVNHLLTQAKVLNGLPELIKQLHLANVDPELVINERVKAELYGLKKTSIETQTDNQVEESETPFTFEGRPGGGTVVRKRKANIAPDIEMRTESDPRKRKLKTSQEIDRSMGIGSSEQKYRKIDNEPTDIVNSSINWDTNEEDDIPDASNVNLPDDGTDDL